jgi:hypothetical protein
VDQCIEAILVRSSVALVFASNGLLLAQDQVHDPASPNMRPRRSAMAQDCVVIAPSFVKGIRQFWHPVEGPVFVGRLRQVDHCGREASGVEGNRAKGVAEEITEEATLSAYFVIKIRQSFRFSIRIVH